jgi:hypothetical protein
MPINKYYKGHGDKVAASMKKTYGARDWKKIFYATANKNKLKPVNNK